MSVGGLFEACSFVLDLGNVSFKYKDSIKNTLLGMNSLSRHPYSFEANKGSVSMAVFPTTTCLVSSESQIASESMKVKQARKYNVAVVTDNYILDCVKRHRALDVYTLILDGKMKATPEVRNRLTVVLTLSATSRH